MFGFKYCAIAQGVDHIALRDIVMYFDFHEFLMISHVCYFKEHCMHEYMKQAKTIIISLSNGQNLTYI